MLSSELEVLVDYCTMGKWCWVRLIALWTNERFKPKEEKEDIHKVFGRLSLGRKQNKAIDSSCRFRRTGWPWRQSKKKIIAILYKKGGVTNCNSTQFYPKKKKTTNCLQNSLLYLIFSLIHEKVCNLLKKSFIA